MDPFEVDQQPYYGDVELPFSPYAPNIDWGNVTLPTDTYYGNAANWSYDAAPSLMSNLLSGNFGQAFQQAGSGIADLSSSALKALLYDKNDKLDMQKLATIGGGLAGLLGAGKGQTEKVGYQGQVPVLSAVRERVPQAASTQRPGAGGKRYFSDTQYVAPDQAAAAQAAAAQQAQGLAQLNAARPTPGYAEGGIAQGYYLGGDTDGMADEIPANIDGKQPAKLSDGEFVVPADVVSHLGNGNSEAGAQRLYEMMDRIRKARTGTAKQGRQINPNKLLPK
ncbi:MAG: hypothetical protein EHM17_00320 [Verrucomicrobiaceae bacterium]|nr:MAG: hypothetical protein EHM17_17245 [Verrucomicrobiaceae bacterium]RPJ30584.1 MAG: hypothetical protein EHM17_16530 [Verrucomicrobiaceae bacterium]RPJ31011.1 MAG: hypothetical protein EHM17_15880 [Verrucomicrobiaceae bacterium]RPJ34495.1 MAG: hypothetical protein EHM17_06385 [Verrucomicrobiaceae bacterium]RPJ36021.1 MAG: hypothetical protein EHM17_00320 [Verrucomicrobiaceae bacterium]